MSCPWGGPCLWHRHFPRAATCLWLSVNSSESDSLHLWTWFFLFTGNPIETETVWPTKRRLNSVPKTEGNVGRIRYSTKIYFYVDFVLHGFCYVWGIGRVFRMYTLPSFLSVISGCLLLYLILYWWFRVNVSVGGLPKWFQWETCTPPPKEPHD